jgi:hypothetical protein
MKTTDLLVLNVYLDAFLNCCNDLDIMVSWIVPERGDGIRVTVLYHETNQIFVLGMIFQKAMDGHN